MVIEIPLACLRNPGLVALVDDEDAALVMQFKWAAIKRRVIHGPESFYARRTMKRHEDRSRPNGVQYMHRLLMPGVAKVDHKNGQSLDNRRSNLRPATNAQNQANRKTMLPGASSRFRGVFWHRKQHRWLAGIGVNGKHKYLGAFREEEQAAAAYDKAAILVFGEFANLNFPMDELPEAVE